jgi:hypothetical protein
LKVILAEIPKYDKGFHQTICGETRDSLTKTATDFTDSTVFSVESVKSVAALECAQMIEFPCGAQMPPGLQQ